MGRRRAMIGRGRAVLAGRWAQVRGWYRRHAGVRTRSALAAAVVVALVLAVAIAAFVLLYRRSLERTIDADASRQARTVAADLARTGVPEGEFPTERGGSALVQVLRPDGTVLAWSGALRGRPPMSAARPAAGRLVNEGRRGIIGHEDRYRVAAIGVGLTGGTYTVVVGESLEPIRDSVEDAAALLIVGYPVLVVVVAGATYAFVGRSLGPVEAIRRKVAGIGAARLGDRVPVPEARDEVARLAETMNEMLDRLEKQVDARRRFVADAGHELRSPLTTLRTGLEVLGTHPLADRDTAVVELLTAETARLERLVDDLILLARADERELRPRLADVDLDDLLEAERHRLAAQHPGLAVTAAITPVRMRGDAHRLGRVLRNLADNAATHAEQSVRLTLREVDGNAIVEVVDDGPGIPVEERERVFERFVRLDESRRRDSGGTGLGLAITREVVTAHGGTVEVFASARGGALFRVVLPVDAGDEATGR
ncbi:sensor histidine kinase [Embleya sp. NPDC020630]|uniref:sensor histidine kinase n=1 Tax=Embleya sp. NPDC020630 TaxID=3363979 RepID=UPI0037A45977